MRASIALVVPFTLAASAAHPVLAQEPDLGPFESHGDIGAVGRSGSATYDPATGAYHVTAGGENMWGGEDGLHYVWTEVSGDVSLAADVRLQEGGGHPHRKAGVMLRQSLDPDAPYADVVVHADGLASLQFRTEKGGETREIRASVEWPGRVRIEREGEYVYMSLGDGDGRADFAGGSVRVPLRDPYYAGLAVSAHDSTALAGAVFEDVDLRRDGEPVLESTLEILDVATGNRQVVHHVRGHIEAPNWLPDGERLLYNRGGRLFTIPVGGGEPSLVDTGFATRINNDHGVAPDGSRIVISDQSRGDGGSRIYTLPAGGGTPELVTPRAPSYWHGWSPDGRTLAYVADRAGDFDIYTIPVEGGEERRLTTASGLDDGPDYTPDGAWIYFNSVRTGTMQIWRMRPDGTDQEQVTSDAFNDWFPHPSPDGRWIVFLSYGPDVEGHPANRDVLLRILPIGDDAAVAEPRVLTTLFGGQGTINVPSWSPDGERIAFVSYRLRDRDP